MTRGAIDAAAAGDLQRRDRRQRLALEAQRRVGRILDDGDIELGREVEQALARGKRQRLAGRVGEVGHDVGELDAPAVRGGGIAHRTAGVRLPCSGRSSS